MGNETGPLKAQTFGYDGNGNRTSDGAGSYAYLANSNRLQTALGQAIATDPAGNITGDGVYTYVCNQAGQLAQVLKGATTVASYGYDYRRQRTRKQAGATTTLYHYDQAGHLIAESDTSGNILRTYVWRDDTPYAVIESSSGRDQVYYLEVDTLNTPRTARDQTGTIVWQWYSDAFGSTLPNEDPDGNGVLTHINLRFPGQYFDPETGLYYNMARYYNPGIGRYLQADPVGLAGGVNSFTYVNNNPINHTDSSGLIIDTLADIGFIAYDLYKLATDGACERKSNLTALGLDFIGAITLGVTGLGAASRVAQEAKLTAEQIKNIERFEKKIPANARDSLDIKSLPNGGVVVQGTSPGRVPGSSAVYEKQIDAAGNTIQYTKTTYDPAGNIIHVRDKLNGGVYP